MLPEVRSVKIGNVSIGGNNPLALIAGPCVIESEEHCLHMAEEIAAIATRLEIPYIFKASFDKANRSSVDSYRGPGLEEGLAIIKRIKEQTGLPALSDIHTAEQAAVAGEVLDCLQIPAFLSRQTDILVAAGKTGKAVAVKKGQFLAPWDMASLIGKIESTGNRQIMVTERGFTFGYNNLVTDMRALPAIRKLGVPVIMDATHSVQLPGGQGSCSGGEREYVPTLARAAAAAGIDALFLEVHDQPEKALCDGPNMIPLAELEELLRKVRDISNLVLRHT